MDLEQVIKQSQGERYVYPDIFPDNCGLDIVLPNDKLHAVRSWGYRKNNPRRRATLEVSTFRGISFNAIHYYGKINIQGGLIWKWMENLDIVGWFLMITSH